MNEGLKHLPWPEWNRFGDRERKGALNFIGAEQIKLAAGLVKRGEVIPLNRPLDQMPPAVFGRPPMRRTVRMHNQIRPFGRCCLVVNDDVIEIAPHGGSHWDAFAHFGLISPDQPGIFYGGGGVEETLQGARAKQFGIDAFSGGIVSRGVLIDVVRTVGGADADTLPVGHRITDTEIEATLKRQNTELTQGDVAFVYTGFQRRYEEMEKAGSGEFAKVAGVDGSTLRIWQDAKIAALVSDNVAVDALPSDQSMHIGALRNLGIPLGELWDLEALATACRKDSDYAFLLVSVPLNVPGGFGSPSNAVAIR